MNKVYISGMITREPIHRMEAGDTPHLILLLGVRHRNRAGESRRETYRVSAWNRTADWARDNLTVGQIVAAQGYLAQHNTKDGQLIIEITAEEFIPSRQTAYQPVRDAAQTEKSDDSDAADCGMPADITDVMTFDDATPAIENTPVRNSTAIDDTSTAAEAVTAKGHNIPAGAGDSSVEAVPVVEAVPAGCVAPAGAVGDSSEALLA